MARVVRPAEIRVLGAYGNCFGEVAWLGEFAGITLAETHYTADTVVPDHRHEFPGFFMPLRGGFELVYGEARPRIGSGRACCHCAEDVHSMRVLSPTASGLNVEIKEGSTKAFVDSRHRVTPPGSRIPLILTQLHRELRVHDAASTLAVQGLVLQATGELLREKRLPEMKFESRTPLRRQGKRIDHYLRLVPRMR